MPYVQNSNPNPIDRNAASPNRVRRNWQRARLGALSSTLAVTAPITNSGGSTGLGLALSTGTGLVVASGKLAISTITESQVVGLVSDLAARLFASTALGTTAPLSGGGKLSTGLTLSIPQATSTANGYLSSTDWTTFNNKGSGTGISTSITTTAPLAGGGATSTNLTLSIPQATTSANGYLSSTDWTTFNGKQAAGNYVSTGRLLNTTAPLAGGGDLTADRTLSIPKATATANGYLSSTDWTTFNNKSATFDTKVADSGVISNTTAETAFTSSTLFPANTLTASTMIRLTGEVPFQVASNGSTLTLNWYWNFSGGGGAKLLLATTGGQTVDGFGAGVNVPYPIDLILMVRSSGSTAQLYVGGNAFIPAPSGNTFHFFGNGPLTFDSTVANALQMTATWGVAAATSQVKCAVWNVEVLP